MCVVELVEGEGWLIEELGDLRTRLWVGEKSTEQEEMKGQSTREAGELEWTRARTYKRNVCRLN
jgi:hypothetical protein